MSCEAVNAVFQRAKVAGVKLLVLVALAERVHGKCVDVCWPSVSTLAKMTRLSDRQVRRVIHALVQAGEVAVEDGAGMVVTTTGAKMTNRYRLTPGGQPITPKGERRTPDKAMSEVRPGEPLTNPTRTPDKSDRTPDKSRRTPDIAMSADPESDPELEPEENRKRDSAGLPGRILAKNSEQGKRRRVNGKAIDYSKHSPRFPSDYSDFSDPKNDPILLAMGTCRTTGGDKQSWGHWTKIYHRAKREHGAARAGRLFRATLSELWGEIRAGEVENAPALLNTKLKAVFPEAYEK